MNPPSSPSDLDPDTRSPDPQLQRAQEWLGKVLAAMGLPSQVTIGAEDYLELDAEVLTSEQQQILLSALALQPDESESEGEPPVTGGIVLDALQYLANTILNLNQPEEAQRSYTLELAGYRRKRQEELFSMAREAAEKVRATQQEFEFKALSSAERRQVHTYLKDEKFADLETYSRGREPDRRLVIRLADAPTEG